MTVTDASLVLFNYFLNRDCITSTDFSTLVSKKVSQIEYESAFVSSLQQMENQGIVYKYIGVNKELEPVFSWILKQPLKSITQDIKINGHVASSISTTVNDFYKQTGDRDNLCNPLNITQQDIIILMEIIEIVAKQNLENINQNKINEPD